eukprot:125841-Chlamydomonas_euryale.AAC.4
MSSSSSFWMPHADTCVAGPPPPSPQRSRARSSGSASSTSSRRRSGSLRCWFSIAHSDFELEPPPPDCAPRVCSTNAATSASLAAKWSSLGRKRPKRAAPAGVPIAR